MCDNVICELGFPFVALLLQVFGNGYHYRKGQEMCSPNLQYKI